MRLFISSILILVILSLFSGCNLYSPVSDTKVLSSADKSYKIVQWFNEHEINLYHVEEQFDITSLDSVTIGTHGDSIHALVPLYDFFSQLPHNLLSAYKYHSIYIGDIELAHIGGQAWSRTGDIAIDNRQNLTWTYNVIAHEFGHIIYYWCRNRYYVLAEGTSQELVISSKEDTCSYRQFIRGTYRESQVLFDDPFKQQNILPIDYITAYSMTNDDENFAEHFSAVATGSIDSVNINRSELLKAKVLFIKNKIFGGVEPPRMPIYYKQPYE